MIVGINFVQCKGALESLRRLLQNILRTLNRYRKNIGVTLTIVNSENWGFGEIRSSFSMNPTASALLGALFQVSVVGLFLQLLLQGIFNFNGLA